MPKQIGRICNELYLRLSISRDADIDDIKHAYREKAKVYHPDLGGDTEMFSKIYEAYKVLSDPIARKRYDQTGEYLTSSVLDKEHAKRKANEVIVLHFRQLCEKHKENVVYLDVIQSIKDSINNEMSKYNDDIKSFEAGSEFLTDCLNRIETKGDFFNILEGTILNTLSLTDKQIRELKERNEHLKEALNILKNYKFKRKYRQQLTTYSFSYTTASMGY